MKNENIWTVFRVKKKDPETKKWVSELFFMMGGEKSFEDVNFDVDWRFCEVKDKREKAVLIGEANLTDQDWPIRYPLKLKNGVELESFSNDEIKLKVAEQDDWTKKIKVIN